jgi:hypothetical protein
VSRTLYRRVTERGRLFLLPIAVVILIALPGFGRAATFTVNTLTDNGGVTGSGTGSAGDLRYAINQANSAGSAGIVFSVAGSITLNSTLPAITGDLDITGPGGGVTISGANLYRVFVVDGGSLSLTNLTIADGFAKGGDGGAGDIGGGGGGAGLGAGVLLISGSLSINGATFTGNQVMGGNGGAGGAGFSGNISINDASTTTSDISGGGGGGEIDIGSGSGGGGGGGVGGDGTAGVQNTSPPGTGGTGGGGGPFGSIGGGAGIVGSAAKNGEAGAGGGGGISAVAFEAGVVSGVDGGAGGLGGGGGGAIYMGGGGGLGGGGGGALDNLTIDDVAGSGGQSVLGGGSGAFGGGGGAGLGGAIFVDNGTLTILNSTFTGNSAAGGTGGTSGNAKSGGPGGNGEGLGGAIFVYSGNTTIINATIADNTSDEAGGIYIDGGIGSVQGTILAANSGGNCGGTVSDGGFNIADDTANSCNLSTSLAATSKIVTPTSDIGLASGLGMNGGPTATIALEANGDADTFIPKAACTGLTGQPLLNDQRGYIRPVGNTCSAGAYQYLGVLPLDCSKAVASNPSLTAVLPVFSSEYIYGVNDPNGGYNLKITGVTQNKPVPGFPLCPNAFWSGTTTYVRTNNEPLQPGPSGLQYQILFTATDVNSGASCNGAVAVCVQGLFQSGQSCTPAAPGSVSYDATRCP